MISQCPVDYQEWHNVLYLTSREEDVRVVQISYGFTPRTGAISCRPTYVEWAVNCWADGELCLPGAPPNAPCPPISIQLGLGEVLFLLSVLQPVQI